VLFAGIGSVVFKPVTPPDNGNGLGVVQETIQDRASRGHVAQKFAPFLQWPVAGHDGGPVFIPAHDHLKKMLAGVLGQLLEAKIVFRLSGQPSESRKMTRLAGNLNRSVLDIRISSSAPPGLI
jgi:hypothetical protein